MEGKNPKIWAKKDDFETPPWRKKSVFGGGWARWLGV
jgi:hypothetical protein